MARHNNRPSTVASSRYGPATPGPGSSTSDQENRDPTGAARNKGKERAMPPPPRINLPTPTSDPSDSSRGQKRKRSEVQADATQGDQEDEVDSDEEKHTKYYDPNQDPEIRRQVKRKSRALEREFNGASVLGMARVGILLTWMHRESRRAASRQWRRSHAHHQPRQSDIQEREADE